MIAAASPARLIAFDAWANRQVLDQLDGTPAHQGLVELFAHVVAETRAWRCRAQGLTEPATTWPEWDLRTATAEFEREVGAWSEWLTALDGRDLLREVKWREAGREHRMSLGDVISTVAIHATQHRTQIAGQLHRRGVRLPMLTFSTFVAAR